MKITYKQIIIAILIIALGRFIFKPTIETFSTPSSSSQDDWTPAQGGGGRRLANYARQRRAEAAREDSRMARFRAPPVPSFSVGRAALARFWR